MRPDTLPYQINYINQWSSSDPWHSETELYFILSGSATVILPDHSFDVAPEDIFLINAGDTRKITGDRWDAAVLSFRQDMLCVQPAAGAIRFDLCSAGNTYSSIYDYLRFCFSKLAALEHKNESRYSSLSIFYAMYSQLITNFTAPDAPHTDTVLKPDSRLLSVINYINDHFRENLSLAETAQVFNLSAPYFSSFFRKMTGKTFFDYYNEIRLSHAVNDLISSDLSIETIALNNGFGDSRSFVSLFKKQYSMLPRTYRKNHHNIQKDEQCENSVCAGKAAEPASLVSLYKYSDIFSETSEFINVTAESPRIIDTGTINYDSAGSTLKHNYRRMICVGSARQFLYAEVQDMLKRTQKEIHFDYVKFHGMLSDEMMIYAQDKNGEVHYSFTLIDKVMDFLMSVGLKPLCQLSFMPVALASDPEKLIDFYHYNTSAPKDMDKWTDLVRATVSHFVSRYGLKEVRTWLFSIWNEPDETVDMFAWDDPELFFSFYEATWRTVKNICQDFIVGTPSMLISLQKEHGWASRFFIYCSKHGCMPDFLNIHYYDNSLFEEDSSDRFRGEKGFLAENMEQSFPLTADPYAFMKFISNVKALTRKYNMKNIPIYLTEWNLTISHRDLINDTCFKSCHLVKNLLENYDRLESFSYWSLTDFIEEMQISPDLYHGGLGMFTYSGIPKANYNAFVLLTRLGDTFLGKGDGYFITKSERGLSIMLYNYEHYSKLFADGQRTEQDTSDRYSTFEEKNNAQFSIRVTGLPAESVLVKERFINQYAGSSYDTWVRMGSAPLKDPQDLELLTQEARPGLYMHIENVNGGELTLHTRLRSLEVRLLEICLM